MQYINYNGNIYNEHEQLLQVGNRGFRYGDGFFESMIMFNQKLPLLEFHWSRIVFTADVISGVLPAGMDEDKLQSMILDLASVNGLVKNARVRMQFFRKGDGLYLPETDELGFIISMEPVTNQRWEVGEGLIAGIREDCYKTVSMTSDLKTSSALMYVMAARFAKSEGWDECLLLNDLDHVCEAIHSNIFVVKGDKLATPDLDSGCVNGVMRSYMIALLDDLVEERELSIKDLEEADEILLVNAVRGVQWVRQFKGKVYANKKAVEITALLNESLLDLS
ncbi:MAG: aminotransferase class IV [Chitinophagales bacterium]